MYIILYWIGEILKMLCHENLEKSKINIMFQNDEILLKHNDLVFQKGKPWKIYVLFQIMLK